MSEGKSKEQSVFFVFLTFLLKADSSRAASFSGLPSLSEFSDLKFIKVFFKKYNGCKKTMPTLPNWMQSRFLSFKKNSPSQQKDYKEKEKTGTKLLFFI